jgi:exonuclease III
MAEITTYLSILTLNVNGLNFPIKRHCLANWIKKEDLTICCLQETHLTDRNKYWLRVKDWKKITKPMAPENCQEKQYLYQTGRFQTYIDQMR